MFQIYMSLVYYNEWWETLITIIWTSLGKNASQNNVRLSYSCDMKLEKAWSIYVILNVYE